MEPDRWRKIDALLQAVHHLAAHERAAFLDEACAGDDELRREIESLLAHGNSESAEYFLEDSAMKVTAQNLVERQDLSGRKFGRYSILKLLGEGGMGRVYFALDEELRRPVAIKFLPDEFSMNADRVRRFEQEARAASALNHPNIVTIHEIGRADHLHFIATEFIEGLTLRDKLKSGEAVSVKEALEITAQIADALQTAHQASIIHRDIKPENIMLRAVDGRVKVIDFGIAGMRQDLASEASPDDAAPSPADATNPEAGRTALGTVIGTKGYMSPEQARGELVDKRTDIYSLGVVLFEMLTGKRPFETPTRKVEPSASFNAALSSGLPGKLPHLLQRSLQHDPANRFASAGELLDELKQVQHRLATRTTRRLMAVGAGALLLTMLAVAAAMYFSVTETWEEKMLRDGHSKAARRAAFSRDGRWLVTVGVDNKVIIWDFARRERYKTLTDHQDAVTTIAFSPDGKLFATGSDDQTVIVWDAKSFEKITTLREHRGPVISVGFSPNGHLLAAASDGGDKRTVLWETNHWTKVQELPEGTGGFGNLLFSPDSHKLSLPDGEWDLSSGQKIADGKIWAGWNHAAFSPDGRLMVKVDGTNLQFRAPARPGEAGDSRLIAERRVHHDNGRAVAFSPNGKWLATGAKNIAFHDAITREIITWLEYDSIVWSLTFSPDSRWLVSTHGDGSIVIWDALERKRVGSLNGHSEAVRAIAVSPDGKRIASAGEDWSVIIWNADTGLKEAVLTEHQASVIGVVFSPDGKWLASCDQDGLLIRWDLEKRRPQWKQSDPGDAWQLTMSPDGRWLVNTKGVFDSRTGQLIVNLWDKPQQMQGSERAAFSADGRLMAAVAIGRIYLLNTATWQIIAQQEVDHQWLSSIGFSPDGRLVTGSTDGTVSLWEAEPLRRIAVIGKHEGQINSIAFSPAGRFVATAGVNSRIEFWDVSWRRYFRSRPQTLSERTSNIFSIAFSSDGKYLVSGERDKSVRLFTRYRTMWGTRLD